MTQPFILTPITRVTPGKRLASMLLDHVFMSIISMIFFMPFMVSLIASALKEGHEPAMPEFGGPLLYVSLIGFALYLCKDSFGGRSIAKRILKLQVVDNTTNPAANPLKCFVRNIFILIWPVEVIMVLADPQRRLGDRVAGTKVVTFEPTLEAQPVQTGQALLCFVMAYALMFLFMLPFQLLFSSIQEKQIRYIESSLNTEAADNIEQILTDSLGEYFEPDVVVYDQMKENDLRYVSAILRLKNNYLESEEDIETLTTWSTDLISREIPEESFTGQLKFIYQQPGKRQVRTVTIGTE